MMIGCELKKNKEISNAYYNYKSVFKAEYSISLTVYRIMTWALTSSTSMGPRSGPAWLLIQALV